MPWSEESAQQHTKKANTPARQRIWAHVANAVRELQLDRGDSETVASVKAIETANATLAKLEGSKK